MVVEKDIDLLLGVYIVVLYVLDMFVEVGLVFEMVVIVIDILLIIYVYFMLGEFILEVVEVSYKQVIYIVNC